MKYIIIIITIIIVIVVFIYKIYKSTKINENKELSIEEYYSGAPNNGKYIEDLKKVSNLIIEKINSTNLKSLKNPCAIFDFDNTLVYTNPLEKDKQLKYKVLKKNNKNYYIYPPLIPIVKITPLSFSLFLITSINTFLVLFHISSGLCSTHPFLGKYCLSSSCDLNKDLP